MNIASLHFKARSDILNIEQLRMSLQAQRVLAFLCHDDFAAAVTLYKNMKTIPEEGVRNANVDAWFKTLCGKQTRPSESRISFVTQIIADATEAFALSQHQDFNLKIFLLPLTIRYKKNLIHPDHDLT